MISNWDVQYIIEKVFLKAIRYCPCMFQKVWFEEDMNIFQNFKTTKVLVLGLSLGSPRKKWHLDLTPMENHKIYYREGSGVSSQRLQVVQSLCLKLFQLSMLHHLFSTCIDHLFSLVVHVDFISKFCLWVRLNAPTRPPTPKVLQARECALTLGCNHGIMYQGLCWQRKNPTPP
jgi:hypothetical protein